MSSEQASSCRKPRAAEQSMVMLYVQVHLSQSRYTMLVGGPACCKQVISVSGRASCCSTGTVRLGAGQAGICRRCEAGAGTVLAATCSTLHADSTVQPQRTRTTRLPFSQSP
jgi:hypothetical protein